MEAGGAVEGAVVGGARGGGGTASWALMAPVGEREVYEQLRGVEVHGGGLGVAF